MFKRSDVKDILPLSPTQEGLLFHWLMDKNSGMYTEQLFLTVRGKVDMDLLEKSLNKLVEKYDILRTVFIYKKVKVPQQVVLKKREITIHFEDVSHWPDNSRASYIEQFKKRERETGFDLEKDILMRMSIIKSTPEVYLIIWNFHDILMDGWCLGIIYKDLFLYYDSLQKGNPIKMEPVVPYSNYLKWLKKQDKEKGLKYWRKYLEGYNQLATLPPFTKLEKKKNENQYHADGYVFTISEELSQVLIQIGKENQVTLNTIFQSIWGILLQRYNNTADVIFGAVVSGRPAELEEIENMIGLFINTIPVRIHSKMVTTFSQLIKKVQTEALLSKEYEYLRLVELMENSPLKSHLLDHIIIFENYPIKTEAKSIGRSVDFGFKIKNVDKTEQLNYDFNIIVGPGKIIAAKFSFNSLVYNPKSIEKIASHFLLIVKQVVENPMKELTKIDILTREEKQQILYDFNNTAVKYPKQKTIQQLLIEQEAGTPGFTALGQHTHWLTYKKLHEESNQLARMLKHEAGVLDGDIVGLYFQRSLEMIIAILAVIKANAVCLPLDPQYPAGRIKYILEDSGAKIVLKSKGLSPGLLIGAKTIEIDKEKPGAANGSNIENQPCPDSLVYLIYTSGSTGKPKGVMLHHPGIVNHLFAIIKELELEPEDVFCHNLSINYIVSIWQIFGPLVLGSKLMIYPEEVISHSYQLFLRVDTDKVSILEIVPSLLSSYLKLLESGTNKIQLNRLRMMLLTGEKLGPSLVHTFYKNYKIPVVNAYGQTECSDDTLYYKIPLDWQTGNLPIGKPSHNICACILGIARQLQPIGVPGELSIWGDCLAIGYLNRPGQTKEKFVPHPLLKNQRMYLTGDLALWSPGGNIEFLSRIDRQVKIRGIRIEPGEIETQLLKHKQIKETVVLAREDSKGDNYLYAFTVPANQDKNFPTISTLREFLSLALPAHMIPAYFIRIEKIPLTPNGKIDKKALFTLGNQRSINEYIAPRNELEEKLVELWSGVLRIEKNIIGIDSPFFELGGHSLKAIELAALMFKEFNIRIPIPVIFKTQTVRTLEEYIKEAKETQKIKADDFQLIEKKEYYAVSSAQKRLFIHQQMDKESIVYNMPIVLVLKGEGVRQKLEDTFRQLIDRHESFKTSFNLINNEPVQMIHDEVEFSLEFHEKEEINAKEIVQHFIRPFGLDKAPLLRVGLIKLTQGKFVMMVDMHHIITDGTSLDILIRDFFVLYEGGKLPGLKFQYKDFSGYQDRLKGKGVIKKQEEYWLTRFKDKTPGLNLPTDYKRPLIQDFEGGSINFGIDKNQTALLRQLAIEEEVTMFMVLLSIYFIFLSKFTGQEDIVVGIPSVKRHHPDLQNLVGMLINILPIRNQPKTNQSFKKFLAEVKENLFQAYENQDYQLDILLSKLNLPKDPSRHPLFEVTFQLETSNKSMMEDSNRESIQNIKITPFNYDHNMVHFSLSLWATERDNEVYMYWEYMKSLFKKSTVEKFVQWYMEILDRVLTNRYIELKDITISSGLKDIKTDVLKENLVDFGF